MPSANRVLEVYVELADLYEKRGQAQLRDRFLVLAADAALSAGRAEEAERLRLRLLQLNPHHMLKPYASLQEALKVADVQDYIAKLRLSYAPETAEQQLQSLRAGADVPGQPEAAPRSAAPKSRPPETPPKEAKESPDVQLFYPVADDADDLAVTMPPRKRTASDAGPKPPVLPPPSAPVPPARKHVSDIPPAPLPPAKKPARPPALSPYAMEPPRPAVTRPSSEKDEQDLATGYWVSTGLFVLLLLAGVALAGYTFVRPFLPAEWFR